MGGDLDVASVPGSGSAFVLVLPGPTSVAAATVAAALERALATEEQGLEERAVLRALAASPELAANPERRASAARAFPGLASRTDRDPTSSDPSRSTADRGLSTTSARSG